MSISIEKNRFSKIRCITGSKSAKFHYPSNQSLNIAIKLAKITQVKS